MQIKTIMEQEDGTAEFTANLSNNEVNFLLEFAINNLLAQGVTVLNRQKSSVHELHETEQ